jgi:hypothetical protein
MLGPVQAMDAEAAKCLRSADYKMKKTANRGGTTKDI